ncbi:MAG: YbfB/YjiJ family MFS transporter [Neisseriaceae bacterium]|nr:YbfB/YjiJ family MFS transporter [Neisseriaceae bacterium]MBP6862510.1 YbfB/YjiJ family MFS transporter [Neisseriaceae bacterium]
MPVKIAFSGFVALMVAMGIGRFAYTPQVPLMMLEGQLTLTSAGIVAAFNYLGYLVGAFDAMRAQRRLSWRLWLGLWGAVLLTLLSAFAAGPWGHSLLRFLIGCASGWAMVLVSAWCNDQLAQLQRPRLSAAVFAGPGTGIALSGLLAIGIHHWGLSASQGWWVYGIAALLLAAVVVPQLPRQGAFQRPNVAVAPLQLTGPLKRLVGAYGLAGFGYILPATFLSQMAVQRFPDSLFTQFVWPIFGAMAVGGVLMGILTRHWLTTAKRLALVLWLQALGILAVLLLPSIWGLIWAAVLVGGGFLSIVQLALQYGRELAPDHSRYLAGLLTTAYAVGQLVGPMLSAASSAVTGGLTPALLVALVGLLVAGTLVLLPSASKFKEA